MDGTIPRRHLADMLEKYRRESGLAPFPQIESLFFALRYF
jgi:hypothetical protein